MAANHEQLIVTPVLTFFGPVATFASVSAEYQVFL